MPKEHPSKGSGGEAEVSSSILLQQRRKPKREFISHSRFRNHHHHYHCHYHKHSEALNSSMFYDRSKLSYSDYLKAHRGRKYQDAPSRFREPYQNKHHHQKLSGHCDQHHYYRSSRCNAGLHKHCKNQQRRRRSQHLKKRYQTPEMNNTKRRPLLQFSQSEYRRTVTEDVPLHTSILTVSDRHPLTSCNSACISFIGNVK